MDDWVEHPQPRRASSGSVPHTSRRSSRSGSWDPGLDTAVSVLHTHGVNVTQVLEEGHEAEASALDTNLDDLDDLVDLPTSASIASPQALDLDLGERDRDMDMDDEYDLGERTYSSLPPSPRAEASAEFGLERSLDLSELHGAFHAQGIKMASNLAGSLSPRRDIMRRGSLTLERESASAGEEDEQFWPARSRRQTLENGDRPSNAFNTITTSSTTVTHSVLEVHEEGEEPTSPTSPVRRDDDDTPSVWSPDLLSPLESPLQSPRVGVPPNLPFDRSKEGLSLWDLLRDEDAADQWEGWIADGKWERIANFLAVPLAVEKVTMFGALLCLDGFLYNFTILPIRALFAVERIFKRVITGQPITPIPPAHLQSLLRLALLVIPALILMVGTDASKMYHSVRGQDTIKLYVIFNALEIGDRLCCAFGQDVLDTLFARATLTYRAENRKKWRKREHVRPVFYFTLSLAYVLVHALVFFYMLISLNVAINSYDYTLISLLISNQFVEIKGSVFKKFEKENLFQIMCADIVERFQLGLMLSVIAVRNMIEMSGSDLAFLPRSFARGKSLIESILWPVLFVLASEVVVDWLKHAFISKFNHVRATVYGRFMDVLAKDVLLAGTISSRDGRTKRKHPILLDQSPLVVRRLGIASVPLAVLVIRICAQIVGMLTMHTSEAVDGELSSDWIWTSLKWAAGILIAVALWGCLVAIKILLGLGLLSFSALRQAGMEEREADDAVNDFGRTSVGESKEETAYHKSTSRYLSRDEDDLPQYPSAPVASVSTPLESTPRPKRAELGEKGGREGNEDGDKAGVKKDKAGGEKGGKKKWRLEEVERWTMVKRIW